MGFAVAADAYDRFMGRYSAPLAPLFADFAGIAGQDRVLDVGCGPGALTSVLSDRLRPGAVAAIDPSGSFVAAVRARCPGVEAVKADVHRLPFGDRSFDVAVAQLVVHFMADPVAGLREMARATRPGGVVAACVWDHEGGGGPLDVFWRAVRDLDPDAEDEGQLAGARRGHLAELLASAGLHDIEDTSLEVSVEHQTFDEWWEPYTLGVGPAGAYVASLDVAARDRLREGCRSLLPRAPFRVTAAAWAARGVVAPARR